MGKKRKNNKHKNRNNHQSNNNIVETKTSKQPTDIENTVETDAVVEQNPVVEQDTIANTDAMEEQNIATEQNQVAGQDTVEEEAVVNEDTELQDEKKKMGKKKWLLLLLLLITIGSISAAIWGIFFRKPPEAPNLIPDSAPGPDGNAEEYDKGKDKMKQPKGGGAVSISYSKDVTIDLSDKKATLMFANPSRSNQGMVIQIVIHDTVVAQSKLLKPGYQVKKLDLLKDSKLDKPGKYNGKFNILFYDPDTGNKAVVNTEIPITINVKK